jgi:hypothetical protein
MPRRKKYTILAKELACYDEIVSELEKLPQVADEYDMITVQITVLKKIDPYIKDIEAIITHFERYLSANRKYIQTFEGEELINRVRLAKMLGISRQSLSEWIKKGFITPVQSKYIPHTETFYTNTVLEQLKQYKTEHPENKSENK